MRFSVDLAVVEGNRGMFKVFPKRKKKMSVRESRAKEGLRGVRRRKRDTRREGNVRVK